MEGIYEENEEDRMKPRKCEILKDNPYFIWEIPCKWAASGLGLSLKFQNILNINSF